jgi:post-segregation antitoxin (ccd killing protein)
MRRRKEIEAALAVASFEGLKIHHLVLTFQHSKGDSLSYLLERFNAARRAFFNRKLMTRLRKSGEWHRIRVIEVTWGRHGWHLHSHEIIICEDDLKPYREAISKAWIDACDSHGLKATWDRGISLLLAETSIAAYLSTWSAAAELTGDLSKQARDGNLNILQILEAGVNSSIEEKRARELHETMLSIPRVRFSEGFAKRLGVKILREESASVWDDSELRLLTKVPERAWVQAPWRFLEIADLCPDDDCARIQIRTLIETLLQTVPSDPEHPP